MRLEGKIRAYAELVRLDKPIGILLLLWPTMMAVVLANHGRPSAKIVFIFLAGVFFCRALGCVFNDILDKTFDREVKRTKNRPLPSGRVSVWEALILAALLALCALALVLMLNRACVILAVVAVILAALYPLLKRVTYLPQIWLGLVFNLGIIMAYIAAGQSVPFSGFLLYLAAACSTVAYDAMYALVDKKDDLQIGLKSIVMWFGDNDCLIIAILQLASLVLLLCVGVLTHHNLWYLLGLVFALLLACYQQYLIRTRKPAYYFLAFKNNHIFWMMTFVGLVLSFLA